MNEDTISKLEDAIKIIESLIENSLKVQGKFKEGTSQFSLLRNRVKALKISLALINKWLGKDNDFDCYNKDDLISALSPINSTIKKCEVIKEKAKEGSSLATRSKKILSALYIARSLIKNELAD